ncbi:MAG: glycosyltransferase family 9 protein [Candidatus Krumholzibacteria bacterium]|nr:glycosyltransferase family 9 protein [Candidatus Krumholzibacteria bacterium]
MNNILIVRTDRLGDVLLTTPVSTALRRMFPRVRISWLVRPYTAPLLEHNPDIDRILVDRDESPGRLAERIRNERFDAAIVAYPRWRIVWALWLARVPLRIGPANTVYCILLNRRVRQRRSNGKKHEADYNLELLEPLGASFKRYPTRYVVTDEERRSARSLLKAKGISGDGPVVILHPGSGGSSARWPLERFMALGDELQAAGCDLVVTGGPGEDHEGGMIGTMRRKPAIIAAGSVSIRELAAVLSWADLVVTNSTGPLHLAVALGVPTVSIYSPIPTRHPARWGPYPAYGEGDELHHVFLAPLKGGGGKAIEDMGAVSAEEVLRICRAKLAGKTPRISSR